MLLQIIGFIIAVILMVLYYLYWNEYNDIAATFSSPVPGQPKNPPSFGVPVRYAEFDWTGASTATEKYWFSMKDSTFFSYLTSIPNRVTHVFSPVKSRNLGMIKLTTESYEGTGQPVNGPSAVFYVCKMTDNNGKDRLAYVAVGGPRGVNGGFLV